MGVVDLQYLLWLVGIVICVKVFLVLVYYSMDFEVYRYWFVIMYFFFFKEWYFDEFSQWIFDYFFFFVFFEWFFVIFVLWFDFQIVDLVNGQNYVVRSVVLFQRGIVMVVDFVFYWGLWEIGSGFLRMRCRIFYLVVIFLFGFLIVDYIYFQYNGFLFGILFLLLVVMWDGNDLFGGIYFVVLVCFKYLFVIVGLIYFVYILWYYCKGFQKIV